MTTRSGIQNLLQWARTAQTHVREQIDDVIHVRGR
jgi:hypothetical protein